MAQQRVRVFISSPGDVAEERVLATKLVRRLADEYAARGRHRAGLLGTRAAAGQRHLPEPNPRRPRLRDRRLHPLVAASARGCLPTLTRRRRLPTYASGTEYEFEDAVEGRRRNGFPDLLVYRKTASPLLDLKDKAEVLRRLDQKEALDAFMQKWFFDAADRPSRPHSTPSTPPPSSSGARRAPAQADRPPPARRRPARAGQTLLDRRLPLPRLGGLRVRARPGLLRPHPGHRRRDRCLVQNAAQGRAFLSRYAFVLCHYSTSPAHHI